MVSAINGPDLRRLQAPDEDCSLCSWRLIRTSDNTDVRSALATRLYDDLCFGPSMCRLQRSRRRMSPRSPGCARLDTIVSETLS